MADVYFPDVRIAQAAPRLIDATAQFNSPLSGTTRTVGRPGDRWGFALDHKSLHGQDKARIEAFIALMRGSTNRALFSPIDYVQRGSFPSAELLSNNTFSNGTTGWTAGSQYGISAADFVLTGMRTQVTANAIIASQSITWSANTPYVLRGLFTQGRGDYSSAGFEATVASVGQMATTGYGLKVAAIVPASGSDTFRLNDNQGTALLPGDFVLIPFASLSQCMLADNSPNQLLQSDDLTTSWSKTNSTTSANTTTAPDGTSTADSLIEDATPTVSHYISQSVTKSAAAQDWCGVGYFKQNTRSQIRMLVGGVSGDFASCFFDVSAGTISSGPSVAGAVTNARAVIVSVGNGWYRCSLTANIPASVTTANAFASLLSVGNNSQYSGNGTSGLFAWRLGYAQSSVPFLPGKSTTTVNAGAAQAGGGMYVKGLPVSTNGLLLAGDWFEINGELKKVTSSLNSDAAGLGFVQFSPPIRIAPADSDPLIVCKPMGRFIFKSNENGWTSTPGIFADASFDLIEAIG